MRLMALEPNPSYGGGSEKMILALSRELALRGHKVFLLHELEGSMLPNYLEFVSGTFRLSLPGFSLRAPLLTFHCAARIARLAYMHGINVILSSHLGLIRIAALVRGFYGIPFCFHLGLPATGSPHLSRFAYRWIDAGVSPSNHARETWRDAGWPSRSLVTIPNWVDAAQFRPAANRTALRSELRIAINAQCILFVGRVCQEKGLETLIRAFRIVRSVLSDAILVVVGQIEMDYQRRLNELMDELCLVDRDSIRFVSVSSEPEKYFAAADVVCIPSSGETFGLTLLEAMACEVPIVATSIGAFPKIIGEAHRTLLVIPGDHEAIAERLIWWLRHPDEGAALGRRLRERVIKHYGPGQSVDLYENVLVKIACDDTHTTLTT
jgi:glycosyltransferase involved in cell wall biosynthesis